MQQSPIHKESDFRYQFLRKTVGLFSWLVMGAVTMWATAALYFDGGKSPVGIALASVYVLVIVAGLFRMRRNVIAVAGWFVLTLSIVAWWFSLKPTNDRDWQKDSDRTAWAEMDGDQAVIHNIRDFDYTAETRFTSHWDERTVDLNTITGADMFISYWGSSWISHIVVSFSFADGSHLATSVEARKAGTQKYSAVKGFFRQYEVLYLIAEERDVIRVRTNYRGESVDLYRTLTTPKDARGLFVQYLHWMNSARDHAEWYNALTRNCVSNYVSYLAKAKVGGITHWDWRTVLDGRADEMLYDLGDLAGNLPFAELKQKAFINPAAKEARVENFSRVIREGRPGF
jgi:hypothetical protein